MNLDDYYRKYPKLLMSKNAHLEKEFIEKCFYPAFGDNGLKFLVYQKKIHDYDNGRNYFIDFALSANGKKYAIEIDGYSYHGKMNAARFDRQEERTNEITRQGFELIRFSYNKIHNSPYGVQLELIRRIQLPSVEETLDMVDFKKNEMRQDEAVWKEVRKAARETTKRTKVLDCFIFAIPLVLLGIFFLALISPNVKLNTGGSNGSIEVTKEDNRLKAIDNFVFAFNDSSEIKIDNLVQFDHEDESDERYRKTNVAAYASKDYIVEYGNVGSAKIWIVGSDPRDSSKSRIYVESESYDELVNIARIAIRYYAPDASGSLLNNFNEAINKKWGFNNAVASGTWVVLGNNKDYLNAIDYGGYKLNVIHDDLAAFY